MIQDIEPHCYHNEYQNRKAKAGDIALCYRDRETLILEGEQLAFPTLAQLEDSLEDIYERAVYLFAIMASIIIWCRRPKKNRRECAG